MEQTQVITVDEGAVTDACLFEVKVKVKVTTCSRTESVFTACWAVAKEGLVTLLEWLLSVFHGFLLMFASLLVLWFESDDFDYIKLCLKNIWIWSSVCSEPPRRRRHSPPAYARKLRSLQFISNAQANTCITLIYACAVVHYIITCSWLMKLC